MLGQVPLLKARGRRHNTQASALLVMFEKEVRQSMREEVWEHVRVWSLVVTVLCKSMCAYIRQREKWEVVGNNETEAPD